MAEHSIAHEDKDPLFAPERLCADHDDPLIVVGLPRSGSSFLSHILSQLPDWYVFDDLYTHRKARQLGVRSPLSDKNLRDLMFFLGWQIRARLKFGTYAIPKVEMEEVPAMDDALITAFTKEPGSWADLQQEWMMRLARRAGCAHWGYKMPGAFRHIPALRQHYPDSRFLYIMRNPYKVLASYKHMPETSQDGDPRRYHPIAYAIYWRMAARSYHRHKDTLADRLSLVRFEDLTGHPQKTAAQLAAFLQTDVPVDLDIPQQPNSSFNASRPAQALTGLETWIVNRIVGQEIARLGYEVQPARPQVGDLVDLLGTTARFIGFHGAQIIDKLGRRQR